MDGGQDNDTFVVNCVADRVIEHSDGGYDTVVSAVSYVLPSHVEALRLLDGLAIDGTGNALDNRIVGNSQDNLLDGAAGADVMVGGAGDDTYVVDHPDDQPRESLEEGSDTVWASISHTLGPNLENLVLLESSVPQPGGVDSHRRMVNGTGNALSNCLVGNGGNNRLAGGRGNDCVHGGAGHDTYVFARGDGVDTIFNTNSSTDTDTLLLTDINLCHLWLEQVGFDLQIRVLGSSDRIMVSNWYAAGGAGSDHQIERIQMADGQVLFNTSVHRLVQAMAASDQPDSAQTLWTPGRVANTSWLQALTPNGALPSPLG